jgi:hypothetical protein
MLTRSTLVLALVAGLFTLVGCGAQRGETVIKYNRSDAVARTTEVPNDGTYELFYSTEATPTASYPLKKGDKIGFEKEGDGEAARLYAVAGSNRTEVKTTTLTRTVYWKRKTS